MNENTSLNIKERLAAAKRAGRDLTRDDRGLILVAVAGGWLLSFGVRLVFPAMLPHFQEAFDLTLTTSGLLISVLWYAYALGQFPGGALGDRFGGRFTLVASTLISMVTILLVAFAWNRHVLFAATALFGFGTALYGTIRFTILTDIFTQRGGTAVALTMAAGDFGNAVLPPIAVALAALYSWRLGMGFTVPLFLLMGILLWQMIPAESTRSPDTAESNKGKEGDSVSFRYVVSNVLVGPILLVTSVQFLAVFAWQGFTSFYVLYLIQMKEFSAGIASTLFGFFFFMGLIVRPLAGMSHDELGARRTLLIALSTVTLGLMALPFVEGLIPIVALTVILSSLLGFTPITQTFLANSLPADMKGSGLGLLRTSHMLFGATSAIVIGFVADAGYFNEAFLLLAGFSGSAVLLSLFVPPTE